MYTYSQYPFFAIGQWTQMMPCCHATVLHKLAQPQSGMVVLHCVDVSKLEKTCAKLLGGVVLILAFICAKFQWLGTRDRSQSEKCDVAQ